MTKPPPGVPITILDVTHATGQIKQFHGQIHDLLEKWVQAQIKPSQTEEVNFQTAGVSRVFHQFRPN